MTPRTRIKTVLTLAAVAMVLVVLPAAADIPDTLPDPDTTPPDDIKPVKEESSDWSSDTRIKSPLVSGPLTLLPVAVTY